MSNVSSIVRWIPSVTSHFSPLNAFVFAIIPTVFANMTFVLDDPLGLRTKQSTRSTLNKSSVVSKTEVDALFSSDSSDNELLDLYGPNTDGLADYAESSSLSSSLSDDDVPYARSLQRRPKQLDQINKPVLVSGCDYHEYFALMEIHFILAALSSCETVSEEVQTTRL